MSPRYAIGIDLGTSNCALAYLDLTGGSNRAAEVLAIPQLQSLDSVGRAPLLPSCFYYPTADEQERGARGPFAGEDRFEYAVGALAQRRLSDTPGRVIHSAKSWLAHAGVDREAQILPFASDEIAPHLRLSPVEASAAYLDHLRQAWDEAFARDDPELELRKQLLVITVPASFDEGAQVLTRRAAELAGIQPELRLLEEPLAAFHAWLAEGREHADKRSRLADLLPELPHREHSVLVCDMGGGTCDFSLFRIAPYPSPNQAPVIERVAAGDHLLLGGDNIDLAVAHLLEQRLAGGSGQTLTRDAWRQLLPQARMLKERALGGAGEEVLAASVGGTGAGLFSGARSVTLGSAEIRRLVLDGFFPMVKSDELPQRRAGGLLELGLPYAADSAVSRHLAAFLAGRHVDAVLAVGGSMQAAVIRARLMELLTAWQGKPAVALELEDRSLAVAQGAARYAALLATGVRQVRAGAPRSVHVEVADAAAAGGRQLVCVMPQGFEPGQRLTLAEPELELLLNRPVQFLAYTNTHRPQAVAGELHVPDPTSDIALPPLQATIIEDATAAKALRKGSNASVRVRLTAGLTELNLLELALVAVDSGQQWRLEFNLRAAARAGTGVRSGAGGPPASSVPAERLAQAGQRIETYYGKKQAAAASPGRGEHVRRLPRELEHLLGRARGDWDIALLRALWPALHQGLTRRGRSLDHENSWLYLAGFLLRPGVGSDADPWRIAQLWECFGLGLAHRKEKSAQANWWMMWRRTAAGLDSSQQERLGEAAMSQFRHAAAEAVEVTRMLASMERLAMEFRLEQVRTLLALVRKHPDRRLDHVAWALSRLLARRPLYAGADAVLPAALVEESFLELEDGDWRRAGWQGLTAVFAAACRRTGQREIDIDEPVRSRVLRKLGQAGARAEQLRAVSEVCELSQEEGREMFGEELPAGLWLGS